MMHVRNVPSLIPDRRDLGRYEDLEDVAFRVAEDRAFRVDIRATVAEALDDVELLMCCSSPTTS